MPHHRKPSNRRSAAIGGLYEHEPVRRQEIPHRRRTADSGYFDLDGEDDFNQQLDTGPISPRIASNGHDEENVGAAELDTQLAEAAEASRRQFEDELLLQEQEAEQLQLALEQSKIAKREARQRRREERRAISESIALAEENASRRRQDVEMDLAIAYSIAEAQEAERRKVEEDAEARQTASNLRAIKAAEVEFQQEAEAKRKAAAAARKRKEEHEMDMAMLMSLQDLEEASVRPFKRAIAVKDDVFDRQLFVEAKRFQGSVKRSLIATEQDTAQAKENNAETRDNIQHPTSIEGSIYRSSSNQPKSFEVQERVQADSGCVADHASTGPITARVPDSAIARSSRSVHNRRTSVRRNSGPELQAVSDQDVPFDRTITPLVAPVARHGPPPTWLDHPEQLIRPSAPRDFQHTADLPLPLNRPKHSKPSSHQKNEHSSTPASRPSSIFSKSVLGSFGKSFFEPSKRSRTSGMIPSPLRTVLEETGQPQGALTAVATPVGQASLPTPAPQTVNFYGNVVVNNNNFNVGVQSDSSRRMLKQAFSQSYRKVRRKSNDLSGIAAAAKDQTGQIVAGITSGLEALNIGNSRYVTNADMAPRIIGEAYDSPSPSLSRAESPDPALVARLDAIQERLSAPAQQALLQGRPDANGSPASFRIPRLRVVNASTPVSTMQEECEGSQENGIDETEAAGTLPATTLPAPEVRQIERLDPQAPPASITIPRPAAPVHRRPVSGPYEQYPVPIPATDRETTDSPDSMRVGADSPQYMLKTLARKHVHPPVDAALGNVPAADQDLAYTNSRAMMGANRFGDAQVAMPTLAELPGDVDRPAADRSLTPNTKAKKLEKDNQKRLRSRM